MPPFNLKAKRCDTCNIDWRNSWEFASRAERWLEVERTCSPENWGLPNTFRGQHSSESETPLYVCSIFSIPFPSPHPTASFCFCLFFKTGSHEFRLSLKFLCVGGWPSFTGAWGQHIILSQADLVWNSWQSSLPGLTGTLSHLVYLLYLLKRVNPCSPWWCIPAIPAFGSLKQEICHKFKVSPCYVVSSRPGGVTEWDPASNKTKRFQNKITANKHASFMEIRLRMMSLINISLG